MILLEWQKEARDRRKTLGVIPALHTLQGWTPLGPRHPNYPPCFVLDREQRGLGGSLTLPQGTELYRNNSRKDKIFSYPFGQKETSPAAAYAMP